MPEALSAIIHELKTAGALTELPSNEAWGAMIQRINTTGAIHAISHETFWYFLEVLPPHWLNRRHFTFAEGVEPLQLFWEAGKEDYRSRALTWNETERFCQAAGISMPS